MEWKKLEDTLTRSLYPAVVCGDVPNPLNRWLIKSVHGQLASPFDEPLVELDGRILLPWEYNQLPDDVKEANWRFHISDMVHRYQEPNRIFPLFTSEPDKYVYACTGVYVSADTDVVIHVLPYFPSPIRIWINGELVLSGPDHAVFNSTHFLYKLREGVNTVLVECPLFHPFPLTFTEFIVHLHPVEHLLHTGKDQFFDAGFLTYLQDAYCLVPDRSEVPAGEAVRVLVQPLDMGKLASNSEAVTVLVRDSTGQVVTQAGALSGEVVTLSLPSEQPAGVLLLQVASTHNERSVGSLYLTCGELADIASHIEEKIMIRRDCSSDIRRSVQFAASIPSMLRQVKQYVHRGCQEDMLSLLYDAERHLHRAAGDQPLRPHEVFPRKYFYVQSKSTSSGQAACTIQLPDHYNPNESYPVVFFFHDPQARHIPVKLPWTAWASVDNAILVGIPGIGRRNDVDDLQTMRTIRGVLAHLNADRERVYGIGFCYGSVKLFRIAMLVPHLFAALAPITGDPHHGSDYPEFTHVENIQHAAVYGISSVQNWFYNSIRMRYTLSRLPKSKTYMIQGYMHNEVNDFLNSKLLLRSLMGHSLALYPASVNYTVLDPACNKSHWVEGIQLYDRKQRTGTVQAEWTGPGELRVATVNIRELTLLVGRQESGCRDWIRLTVHHSVHDIRLDSDCASVKMTLHEDGRFMDSHVEAIDKESFTARLTAIVEDSSQLGIRKLYVQDPLIVKPSPQGDPRRAFHLRLSFLLQHPISDRYIHYEYRSCYAHQIDQAQRSAESLLYLIDLRHIREPQQEALRRLHLVADEAHAELDGTGYAGEFALVTVRQDGQQLIGVIAYNSDSAGEALLELWKTYDTNPLLQENTAIWHDGAWIDHSVTYAVGQPS
mgnify:CR=1 FL=1